MQETTTNQPTETLRQRTNQYLTNRKDNSMKKKLKPTTNSKQDYDFIGKIAKRAIKLEAKFIPDSRLVERGITDLMMDLTVCHSKHFKLRLSEMLKTEDTASLMHDIYMIAHCVNKETLGWDGLGSPRFTKTR